MPREDEPSEITEKDVQLLARMAALPLDPNRLPMLTAALRNDLRLLATLRGIDVGSAGPASMRPLQEDHHAGR